MMLDLGDSGSKTYNKQWQRYRLPKASHAFDHLWQTEWPRIREVETERYLLDMHGMFYELSPLGWAGSTWGVRPICQHVRVIPDYASFRGMFVAAGNEVGWDLRWARQVVAGVRRVGSHMPTRSAFVSPTRSRPSLTTTSSQARRSRGFGLARPTTCGTAAGVWLAAAAPLASRISFSFHPWLTTSLSPSAAGRGASPKAGAASGAMTT